MAEVQVFEEESLPLLEPTQHSATRTYRPLASILLEPIDLLHCERVEQTAVFKELSGNWMSITARPGVPSAFRVYSVRVGPLPAKDATLHLFKDGERVSTVKTDEEGRAAFSFPSSEPSYAKYAVSLIPISTPFKTAIQDNFTFSVWLVTCIIENKTDVWWRLAGRNFIDKLPRIFWSEAPYTVIGLAAPYGKQTFTDLVPIFGDSSLTLEYGISAYCNTPEPYPTREKCIAYRKNTWWHFKVECFNGSVRKSVEADLNIDRHLKVTVTSDDIKGEVVKPEGAET